jgi:hypothetical protein
MTTLRAFFHPPVQRIQHLLHLGPHPIKRHGPPTGLGVDPTPGPGHAPGHRHLGPPPDVPPPHVAKDAAPHQHHPSYLDTGGRVDRQRRNERHGDEKE